MRKTLGALFVAVALLACGAAEEPNETVSSVASTGTAGGGGAGGMAAPCGGACTDTGQVCVDDSCVCDTGLTSCDEGCVDLNKGLLGSFTPASCGACGTMCASRLDCVDGACVCGKGSDWTPDSRWTFKGTVGGESINRSVALSGSWTAGIVCVGDCQPTGKGRVDGTICDERPVDLEWEPGSAASNWESTAITGTFSIPNVEGVRTVGQGSSVKLLGSPSDPDFPDDMEFRLVGADFDITLTFKRE